MSFSSSNLALIKWVDNRLKKYASWFQLKADVFIEGKNRQSSSQIYLFIRSKNNKKKSPGNGIAESVKSWICIKKAGFKA